MIRTFAAWSAGLAVTVLWGSLSFVGSLLDPTGAFTHRCMIRWSRQCLWLLGTRLEVSGLHHVRADRPQVFAANHQSLVDILVLAASLPVPFRFLAKSELFELPFLGWHMRRVGFIPVDRSHPRQAARVLLQAAGRVAGGINAVVFPEGTRSSDGELLPFRGGAFLLASRARVPIVPVAILGTSEIIRKGQWRVRKSVARVRVLEPIESGAQPGNREALASAVRTALESEVSGTSTRDASR